MSGFLNNEWIALIAFAAITLLPTEFMPMGNDRIMFFSTTNKYSAFFVTILLPVICYFFLFVLIGAIFIFWLLAPNDDFYTSVLSLYLGLIFFIKIWPWLFFSVKSKTWAFFDVILIMMISGTIAGLSGFIANRNDNIIWISFGLFALFFLWIIFCIWMSWNWFSELHMMGLWEAKTMENKERSVMQFVLINLNQKQQQYHHKHHKHPTAYPQQLPPPYYSPPSYAASLEQQKNPPRGTVYSTFP